MVELEHSIEPENIPDFYTLEWIPLGANWIWCKDEKKWTPIEEWRDSEVYCEICGDHPGMFHDPEDGCLETYDLIMNEVKWKK